LYGANACDGEFDRDEVHAFSALSLGARCLAGIGLSVAHRRNDTMVYWYTRFKTYMTYIPELEVSQLQPNALERANHLRAVVEVVPVVASANPVVIRSCVVGLVVGVGRLVEVLTSRGVLGGGSGVEAGGGLSVKSREHFVLRWLHCFDYRAVLFFWGQALWNMRQRSDGAGAGGGREW
jgi:hypothetical protein